jgi:hypothetical protein
VAGAWLGATQVGVTLTSGGAHRVPIAALGGREEAERFTAFVLDRCGPGCGAPPGGDVFAPPGG